MATSITKRNYLLLLSALTLIVGIIGGVSFYAIFPHYYFDGYPIIPLFYWIFGVFTVNMTERCRSHVPQRMLQIYLLLRVFRMLFAIFVMFVYCIAVHKEVQTFLLTFIANYLIYLIFDSWFFFMFELNHKKKYLKLKKCRW